MCVTQSRSGRMFDVTDSVIVIIKEYFIPRINRTCSHKPQVRGPVHARHQFSRDASPALVLVEAICGHGHQRLQPRVVATVAEQLGVRRHVDFPRNRIHIHTLGGVGRRTVGVRTETSKARRIDPSPVDLLECIGRSPSMLRIGLIFQYVTYFPSELRYMLNYVNVCKCRGW